MSNSLTNRKLYRRFVKLALTFLGLIFQILQILKLLKDLLS